MLPESAVSNIDPTNPQTSMFYADLDYSTLEAMERLRDKDGLRIAVFFTGYYGKNVTLSQLSCDNVWAKSGEGEFYRIPSSEWSEMLEKMGYGKLKMLEISNVTLVKLREIMRKMGVPREEDAINEMMVLYKGEKATTILLYGGELKDKVEELIQNAKNRLWITCKVVDTEVAPQIIKAKGRGVDVRIVIPPEKSMVKDQRERKRIYDALTKFREVGISIIENENIHARVMVIDDSAVIGSTDPDIYGLTVHINASILTTSSSIVESAARFIDKLFHSVEK
jgi:hypothetical protein